jgi:hypothetical protein
MELRQLTDVCERQVFAKCLAEARKTRGAGFRDKARSRLSDLHLAFGDIYALFENEDDPAEQMLGGFIMHDLGTFPQTYPRPDLGHLPPQSVIEGSDLWSLSTGTGRVAGLAAAAIAGLLQAKAILVYPMLRPADLTARYSHFNFSKPCEPVVHPFLETTDGDEVWIQPMLLESPNLERYVRMGFDFLFQNPGGRRALRLQKPANKPQLDTAILAQQSNGREENGIAAA